MNKLVKALITVLGLAALTGCQMNTADDTPATVTGIEVTTQPTTTTGYSVLSTAVDTTGMKVSLVWSDGAREDVTSYATVEDIGTSSDFQALTGEQEATYPVGVLYTKDGKDYTAEFNITVQSVYDELRNIYTDENSNYIVLENGKVVTDSSLESDLLRYVLNEKKKGSSLNIYSRSSAVFESRYGSANKLENFDTHKKSNFNDDGDLINIFIIRIR